MKINDNCAACGACKDACPADAIKEGPIYKIDPDKCIECGACHAACANAAVDLD
ncbi:MAG: 4Fe-4S binding protein [Terrimicrobiaceae bacterium]|nr:4Fe-4S binding protein [Terrimicrobiaceae bacterium]